MFVIVDYKVGNIKNVISSFKRLGFDPFVSGDPEQIKKADVVILPGVGAFNDAVNSLRATGIDEAIKYRHDNNLFTIGICLGMQVLFDKSFEDGEFKGLGILRGEFKKFDFSSSDKDKDLKIPHMGWNNLVINKSDKVVNNLTSEDYVYFVHSYYLTNYKEDNLLAYANYGVLVPAIVRDKNTIGIQFHPEKSSSVGEKILMNIKNIMDV